MAGVTLDDEQTRLLGVFIPYKQWAEKIIHTTLVQVTLLASMVMPQYGNWVNVVNWLHTSVK